MQNAETAANVKRDLGAGNLRMAGARLALAQQVAAAKANGTYEAPTADRLCRGDLANNAQDNINSTIEDLKANPDLFGKIAGRYTTIQEMLGLDNPAIRKIAVQIHNAALASNGAHGLRSAQAVPDTEKTILNNFRDNPATALAGLNAMNQSLDTFIQDASQGKHFTPHNSAACRQRQWLHHRNMSVIPLPESWPKQISQARVGNSCGQISRFPMTPRRHDINQIVGPAKPYLPATIPECLSVLNTSR